MLIELGFTKLAGHREDMDIHARNIIQGVDKDNQLFASEAAKDIVAGKGNFDVSDIVRYTESTNKLKDRYKKFLIPKASKTDTINTPIQKDVVSN